MTSAGGWGPVLADQGSGHRIGQEALRAIFLALDEGRVTGLLDAVLQHWQLDSTELLVGSMPTANPRPIFRDLRSAGGQTG